MAGQDGQALLVSRRGLLARRHRLATIECPEQDFRVHFPNAAPRLGGVAQKDIHLANLVDDPQCLAAEMSPGQRVVDGRNLLWGRPLQGGPRRRSEHRAGTGTQDLSSGTVAGALLHSLVPKPDRDVDQDRVSVTVCGPEVFDLGVNRDRRSMLRRQAHR